jgi:hypothetical protein
MLRTMKSLQGFGIEATDGSIGKVTDCYFDDESWVVRYFVVDTSRWLGARDVLISPYSLTQPDWAGSMLPANISRQQVKDSPDIASDRPVSRQYEQGLLGYYGYPYYWGGGGLWGEGDYPAGYLGGVDPDGYSGYQGYLRGPSASDGDPHLHSCKEVTGYHLEARRRGRSRARVSGGRRDLVHTLSDDQDHQLVGGS